MSKNNRQPMYENEMCKAAGLRATCNSCDRIIWEDENDLQGYINDGRGYCKECREEATAQETKVFPNGFSSWMETHFEVVTFIQRHEKTKNCAIQQAQQANGHGGLYDLAEDWTDEFEKKNKGRAWDGDFFDEIALFLDVKLYIV